MDAYDIICIGAGPTGLATAMEAKRGLTFYVKGQSIGGAITKMGNGFVEVRSQAASRIVIRIDSIDAVAMI